MAPFSESKKRFCHKKYYSEKRKLILENVKSKSTPESKNAYYENVSQKMLHTERYMSHSVKEREARRVRYLSNSDREKETERARFISHSSNVKASLSK